MQDRVAFVSTMYGYSWGGSEELWSRTAVDLVAQGFAVSVSVREWSPPHSRTLNLIERGVEVWFRPAPSPLWKHAWRVLIAPKQMWKHAWRSIATPQKTATTTEVQRLLAARRPGLVVFSEGGAFPPIDLLEFCIDRRLPFVTIQQANSEAWWVDDAPAARYRVALAAAQRCYFVSEANQRLTEKQIGCELSNAKVVWNPVNVDFNMSPTWPELGRNGEFRLACVARLHPPTKGQDILFEVLAGPSWAARHWRLYMYGEGPMRNSLERLVGHLGLSDRVVFAGYTGVEEIWASNHVLVMPSRIEGLPLAVIEAMLCGRPVVATDVAGNSEVIEDGVTGFLADAPTAGCMAEALERFWARRTDAQMMGQAGSKRIRQLIPPDPVRVFSDEIKGVLRMSEAAPSCATPR